MRPEEINRLTWLLDQIRQMKVEHKDPSLEGEFVSTVAGDPELLYKLIAMFYSEWERQQLEAQQKLSVRQGLQAVADSQQSRDLLAAVGDYYLTSHPGKDLGEIRSLVSSAMPIPEPAKFQQEAMLKAMEMRHSMLANVVKNIRVEGTNWPDPRDTRK